MPLVFASNDASVSGHAYRDRTGVSYEYPPRYRRTIQPGEPFVYYRGREKPGGGRQPQVYFGAGVVGAIEPSPDNAGLLRCVILDYQPFPTPVPFRADDGQPLEAHGDRPGYYQPGVRRITDEEFNDIVSRGLGGHDAASAVAGKRGGYADPVTARAVDDLAMSIAVHEVARRYPDAAVTRMPSNNPGYDIRVVLSDGTERFIEVKGTQSPQPRFFLSEGERQFSIGHAHSYLLLVVHAIDLQTGKGKIWSCEGPIVEQPSIELAPVQWQGRVQLDEENEEAVVPDAAAVIDVIVSDIQTHGR